MVNRVHVIDMDVRRRARVSRELNAFSVHTEIYEDLREFLDVAPKSGLVLMANNPDVGEHHLAQIIKGLGIHLPIVGYAQDPSTEEVVEAMIAGAAGYLRWPFGNRELVTMLNRISEEGEQRLRRERMLAYAKARVDALSPREREVLTGLIAGKSNKQIAQMLDISPRTVEIHRANMMTKLRARSVAEAVKAGLYAGLDDDSKALHLNEAA
jgi:two-component system, LuxR family, response regulator FixJ